MLPGARKWLFCLAAGARRDDKARRENTSCRELPHRTTWRSALRKSIAISDSLIECLGEVLTDLGHGELAAYLPWFGKIATPEEIENLPPQLGLVYSIAFQLLNMVEESTAAAMRSLRETSEGVTAERGLWGEGLAELTTAGLTGPEIAKMLAQVRVEPVLTAHPTEAKRLSVLDQHRGLYGLVAARERGTPTPSEHLRIREQVKSTLERLWRTGEICSKNRRSPMSAGT